MKAVRLERFNSVLFALVLTGFILFYAKDILMLLVFSALLAMLLNPVAEKLESKGVTRVWSTTICILIVILALSAIGALITAEISQISEQAPEMKKKAERFLQQTQSFVHNRFGISPEKQDQIIQKQAKAYSEQASKMGQALLMGAAGMIASFIMVLVFMFLFLLQKEKYKSFIIRLNSSSDQEELEKVISKISTVSQKYLLGIIYSILIVATLYSIGFLIVGLKNAVLLAFIASIMLIIPYIGAWIGGLIPFTVALVTGDSMNTAIAVACVMVFVQTVDNNLIEPYVVGGEVRLSAAATVLTLLIGSALWGIPGVILFVPLTGILKIIFDNVTPLKPYGYLIGDIKPAPSKALWGWIKKKF
jgi:predicted PurR-regulated permease PerM